MTDMAMYVQDGNSIDWTPSGAVVAGSVVVIGQLVGVAPRDVAANTSGSLQVEGVFEMPKASATVFAAGAWVYFNAGTGLCTTTTTDPKAGVAIAAAGSGSTAVMVKLER